MHMNHMSTEKKTRLLAIESIYQVNMKGRREDIIKNCPTCLAFQATQPKEKTTSYEIPGRLWKSIGG